MLNAFPPSKPNKEKFFTFSFLKYLIKFKIFSLFPDDEIAINMSSFEACNF